MHSDILVIIESKQAEIIVDSLSDLLTYDNQILKRELTSEIFQPRKHWLAQCSSSERSIAQFHPNNKASISEFAHQNSQNLSHDDLFLIIYRNRYSYVYDKRYGVH